MARNEVGVTVLNATEVPPLAEDLEEETEPLPEALPTLAEATTLLADAQLHALTAEQARTDAIKAVHLAEEKLAECRREFQELQEESQTIDPDDDAALKRLGVRRATSEVKGDALAGQVQRAQEARGEATDALEEARSKLAEAEDAHHDAEV